MDDYDKKTNEILLMVPVEFRSVLSYMAYERSHSAGKEEVYNTLLSLVSELKPAIDSFADRMKNRP